MEAELVARRNIPYRSIPAAGIHGVGLRSLPGNISLLFQGVKASRKILDEFKPDMLFFTGGYVAAPMAYAGRNKPISLYVPDIEPGMALKFLARFADSIALTAEESKSYFGKRKQTVVTGYPLRKDLNQIEQATAKKSLNISTIKPMVLIYGGSKGARSINQAVLSILSELLTECQVVHVSGSLDWEEVNRAASTLDGALRKNYFPFPYLHEEMGFAFAAADLVVCRAGASTLGELPFYSLPAILVPYPYAWRYQKVNADHLVSTGGAVIIEDSQLKSSLLAKIKELLRDPARLEKMAAAILSIARPDAASQIADLIIGTAMKKERIS